MATTLDTYAPFDTGPGSNNMAAQWRQFMGYVRDSGVVAQNNEPQPADEMQVYADSTGMQVKVKIGECWITAHWGELTSEKTLPINTAHPSAPRIDRVVARATFTGSEGLSLVVLPGVAGSNPQPPALTSNASMREIPLAQVWVDAGVVTISADKITDERKRVGTGLFNTWTPALLAKGSGSQELAVGLGTGSTQLCRYMQVGRTVHIRYYIAWGTGSYNGWTGIIFLKLPPGMISAPDVHQRLTNHLWTTSTGSMDWIGTAMIPPSTNRVEPQFSASAADARQRHYQIAANPGGGAGSGVPFISGGWPEGGHLVISGSIEIQ